MGENGASEANGMQKGGESFPKAAWKLLGEGGLETGAAAASKFCGLCRKSLGVQDEVLGGMDARTESFFWLLSAPWTESASAAQARSAEALLAAGADAQAAFGAWGKIMRAGSGACGRMALEGMGFWSKRIGGGELAQALDSAKAAAREAAKLAEAQKQEARRKQSAFWRLCEPWAQALEAGVEGRSEALQKAVLDAAAEALGRPDWFGAMPGGGDLFYKALESGEFYAALRMARELSGGEILRWAGKSNPFVCLRRGMASKLAQGAVLAQGQAEECFKRLAQGARKGMAESGAAPEVAQGLVMALAQKACAGGKQDKARSLLESWALSEAADWGQPGQKAAGRAL